MPAHPRNPPRPRAIEFLAFADTQLLDVCGPLQVFASANAWSNAVHGAAAYVTRIVAPSSPVITSSGVALVASPLPRTAALDTLVIAGGEGVHRAKRDVALCAWLARRAAQARRVVSVCTGAFLLGAAGLIDGRRVVTHWSECGRLAAEFPGAGVEVDPIFVRDGALWSSAGVTAGIDLALALIEADLGHACAMAVARNLVVYLKRPGGQAQFSAPLALQESTADFDALHAWIVDHPAADLSVAALAARMTMSERSFVRRYRAATGETPARAVERLRVEAAQHLLLTTAWPLKRIAQRAGFGSEETLRQAFRRRLAIAPGDYRRRFAPGAPVASLVVRRDPEA